MCSTSCAGFRASGSSKFGVLEMHWMTGMPGNDGIKPQRSHHAWDQRSRQSRQWSGCEDQSVPGRDPLSIPIPQLARLRQLRTGQQQHRYGNAHLQATAVYGILLYPSLVIRPVDNDEHQRFNDISADLISYGIQSLEKIGFAL